MPGVLSTLTKTIQDQAVPRKKAPWETMVIPFEKMKPRWVSKEDRLAFKLLSNPGKKDSSTYEVKTYAFDEGPPEEWLEHTKTFKKIIKGQHILNAESQFDMLKRLLKGKALADFDRFFGELSETEKKAVDNVERVLRSMTEELFPERSLQKQRRAMRRYVKKPREMRTSAFYARLLELNEYLPLFPSGDDDSKMSDDELIEILEFALPNTWRMHMTLSRFICSEQSIKSILNHCKEIEGLEAEHGSLTVAGVYDTKRPVKTKSTSSRHTIKRKREAKTDAYESTTKICPIHGLGHSADECHLLKTAIASGKKDFLARKAKRTKFSSNKNKKTFTTEEVNVLLDNARSESVNRALKVHKTVINPSGCRVRFQSTTSDLQEQVDKLKIYRDSKGDGEESSSESERSG